MDPGKTAAQVVQLFGENLLTLGQLCKDVLPLPPKGKGEQSGHGPTPTPTLPAPGSRIGTPLVPRAGKGVGRPSSTLQFLFRLSPPWQA